MDVRPSTAPMFGDPKGANQFLGDAASHHDDQSTVGPHGNRVQAGRLPRASSAPVGPASRANPMGSETTLNP